MSAEHCGICDREMVETLSRDYPSDYALNCGGHCAGCIAVIEGEAVHRFCDFHDHPCVVPNHYANSVHLCSPDQCIEHQDITTLMLNDAYGRYQDGEPNAFFDRLIAKADEAQRMVGTDVTDMTEEEFTAHLPKWKSRDDPPAP